MMEERASRQAALLLEEVAAHGGAVARDDDGARCGEADDQVEAGWVLTCQATPSSAETVVDYDA